MFKNLKTIRLFYRLSQVKPIFIFLQFLTLIIPSILSVCSPILISNTITAITVYDFNKAISQTIIEAGIVLISSISYFIYHLISRKVNKTIITNFQAYIYYNVKNNQNINSINISVMKDIATCAVFNKNIIYKSCFFIKSVIILIIIACHTYILALAIIAVSLITYFFLRLTDRKIQIKTKELNNYENTSVELFNSICGGTSAEQKYNLEEALKDRYFKYVNENIKTTNSISLLYSINNNFISLILKSAVFASTLFLIGQVRSTQLTLSIYLILTPYLTSSAENLISFFDIFSEIALMNNILSHFESLKFTSSPTEDKPIQLDSYNIYIYNVSSNNKSKFENLSLKINYKDCICFVSDEDYHLEYLYKLLIKKEIPLTGCIFLGDKNISDLDSHSFNKYLTSVTLNEQFFSISIYENLFMVCPTRHKIMREIKNLNLQNYLQSFKDNINTIVNDSFSTIDKFICGLVRAYLSGAKIIIVYKLPENLNSSDKTLIKHILLSIKKQCTIICFFTQIYSINIFDEIYQIKNNKIIANNLSKTANNNIRN